MSMKVSILVKSSNLRGIYSLKSWPPIQVVIHTEKQITWPEFKCHQNRWIFSMFGIYDWKRSILFYSSLDTILTDLRWFFSLRNVLRHMWQWSAPLDAWWGFVYLNLCSVPGKHVSLAQCTELLTSCDLT